MGTEIKVNNHDNSVIPKGIVESKLRASQYQMDIIAILLAEIGKTTDIEENLEYTLTAETFAAVKHIADVHEAARILREYICGSKKTNDESMRHIGFEVMIDNTEFRHFNWFEKIYYIDGTATFYLTSEIKKFLVDFKKNDPYKIYAKLRYILPMRSRYSKRIYLMCREFIGSGERFCDNDWALFKEKLQIPSTYNYYMIKKNVLQTAKDEINELTDIEIDYTIKEKKKKGGTEPDSIQFTIKKKSNYDDVDLDKVIETETVDDFSSLSDDEMMQTIQKMQEILKNRHKEV